jgi:methylenetetrahydrofolate dehydrogenase (NADP+)/methenyltetrahydrofolate cyclohydrolase
MSLLGRRDLGTVINGKALAAEIQSSIRQEVEILARSPGIVPGLAAVLVGANPASHIYVRNKAKACSEVGIHSEVHHLEETISQEEIIEKIRSLNRNSKIHGILVQLPLPKKIDERETLAAVSPEKDVDGFHIQNQGKLLLGYPGLRACTPEGILRIIESTGLPIVGKRAVVVGRSNIVGKPIALMLLERHATVTLCHSRTADLREEVERAEILVAAIGQPHAIRGEWIRKDSVVIDVGITRTESGKLVGDVDFDKARERAGFITPVPGGVGPMTIAMLLANTVKAARLLHGVALAS